MKGREGKGQEVRYRRLLNRLTAAAALFAAAVSASASQDAQPSVRFDELMAGAQGAFSLNEFTSGFSNVDRLMDVRTGFGFGAGLALSIPITDLLTTGSLTLNPELNIHYRKLYGYTDPEIGEALGYGEREYKVNMNEFAVSVPVMFRYTFRNKPFYIAAGIQMEFPFDVNGDFKVDGRKASLEFNDRYGFNWGFVPGIGLNLTKRLAADFRWVIGLNKAFDYTDDKSHYDQFSLGVTYLFPKRKREAECAAAETEAPKAAPKSETEEKLESFNSQTIDVYRDERGTILSMSDILFESGNADLKDELKIKLTELAGILKSFLTDSYVIIEGHTDNLGSAEFNQTLSEMRASAVSQFLAERGVDAGRMKFVGYGLTKPVADNRTAEGRTKNRRVELVLTKEPLPKQSPEPTNNQEQ